ncbi:xanthine dehydrogenase family protein molybdopterin-binding subunit [Sphingomonas morindae]|uniref:Xanthine dehydrogenase family protein molybdopterin-binding subunit n=1 Tax=Sphingomonas morindae TaxID=1541170 RepID=A0ABY4XAS3_9SPHN|nr:xanthine dehydrogenase family protein molybdopterin-binding subunit [Sphingomonas morindae]USI74071.1 xanthine dehydrogenase family protein molybdopterin-binding subunit [Sphingomonas morindae]
MATHAPQMSRIGDPLSRVDGRLKTTGTARYTADFPHEGLVYGVIVSSAITRGRIVEIDGSAAEALPGVLTVLSHANRPAYVEADKAWHDMVAPKGSPYRVLDTDEVRWAQQPVALVVAESFEAARHGARLVRIRYESAPHQTDIDHARAEAFNPKGDGTYSPEKSRGDFAEAFAAAPVRVEGEYRLAFEHHNPMEPHAATALWRPDGSLLVHDKTQGSQNSRDYLAGVFGLEPDQVEVVAPFMGGGFGSGLRPQYQLALAALAARKVDRPVKVVMTRQQMFSHQYRPHVAFDIALGADEDGRLQAINADCTGVTSRFETFAENIVDWPARIYACDNVRLDYRVAPIDTYTPGSMRAPGAATSLNLFEIAMDELAYAANMDPLALRLANYSDKDQITDQPYTSKALKEAYRIGAERFGWGKRSMAPRSMKDGRELVGWGMATGVWESLFQAHTVRARLGLDGRLEVANASADIGTGTYTIMTQIASEELGLPVDRIDARLGDSSLPKAPVEGGSWGAASIGNALLLACGSLREKLLSAARRREQSPLANAGIEQVEFVGGTIRLKSDPSRAIDLTDLVHGEGGPIEAEESNSPDQLAAPKKARNTHQAVFVEVKVDEALGQIRVTRVTAAVAAGRIINPKTARSQILGGVVMGIGMALHEETMADHRLGRFMNHNLAEYHVPAHADIADIDVVFVDEPDPEVNPMGIKGLGEIGIVGTAAAVANAIFHATGRRERSLPITIDRLL